MYTKSWKVNASRYTCEIEQSGFDPRRGKARIKYTFKRGRQVIFSGNDFYASPLHDPESPDSLCSLMTFLTCRKGDTDSEYFDNHTPAQIAFRDSADCELLQFMISDWEEKLDRAERRRRTGKGR